MSYNQSKKMDKKTPMIIGGLAALLFLVATYINCGGSTHHVGSATRLDEGRALA